MCQEERLQQQKKNQDEYLRLLREEQQKELKRAESAKDVRAQEQQLVSGSGTITKLKLKVVHAVFLFFVL